MRKRSSIVSRAIAQRLKHKGIKKTWQECLSMLVSLKDLYWTVCEANKKPRSKPLPCPFGDILHRILGSRWEDNFSDPACVVAADLPPPQYQLCTFQVPLQQLPWAPPPAFYMGYPQAPSYYTWDMNALYTWPAPCPYPVFLQGDARPQQE
ncbi:putative uncharacterized protein MSANTD5 [Ochotona princeps]|uniref:putative uncharacterized protein MSANTD5 n=1 Tax=Ochotona princeps TaxID=9978 RepID=UPI002714863E|nr:putative uncharacterized protein MSANTD5 [Ochotona princeps]